MSDTMGWFAGLAIVAGLGLGAGIQIGRGPVWLRRCGIVAALTLMIIWAWFRRQPTVALSAIPVGVMSYVEGSGAVPPFMVIMGIVWSQGQRWHQKRLAIWASLLGAVYFLQGNLWMLQPSPRAILGQTVKSRGVVRQSQDYSCVPASCATALNQLGIYSTEAEMAELTHTRPGTGSTLIRAMDGLKRRLEGTRWRVELVKATLMQLTELPKPLLVPLQFEPTRRHMVVIGPARRNGLEIVDPSEGTYTVWLEELDRVFAGHVLVFRSIDDGPEEPTEQIASLP